MKFNRYAVCIKKKGSERIGLLTVLPVQKSNKTEYHTLFSLVRHSLLLIFLYFYTIAHAHSAPDVWEVLRNQFALNHEISRPEVQQQIRWLSAHPGYLRTVCRQSEPYIYHVVSELKRRGLPGELALLPMIESSYDPFAYSEVGAAGLWQIMPRTGSELGLKQDWWFDGRRSIGPSTSAALNHLVYLHRLFQGNWPLAIAAYNGGEGTISRAMKEMGYADSAKLSFWELLVPRETQIYVPRFLALAEIIGNAQRYNLSLPAIPYVPYFTEVNIGSQIDLNQAAKLAGITYRELIKLNPGYNRWATAPYQPFKLLIPTEKAYQFNLNLAHFPEDKRVSWTKHYVLEGDSLESIANRYHTSPNLIKQLNQLATNAIKLHQTLLIPSTKNTLNLIPKKDITIAKSMLYRGNSHSFKAHPLKEHDTRRVIHIVQTTDSMQRLELLYGVTAKEIQTWNKLSMEQRLRIGQQLLIMKKVHPPKAYIVQRGDNLNLIARHNHTSVTQILALNPHLKDNSSLKSGQKILVG